MTFSAGDEPTVSRGWYVRLEMLFLEQAELEK